jgi:small subunit ribosomal protein S4e
MSHEKRLSSPRTWPISRKGTKYLTRQYPGKLADLSMPLNLIIRDVLKLAHIRKEVKIMIHNKEIFVNGKLAPKEKTSVGLFDVVSMPKIKKNYRLSLNDKMKLETEEVSDAEAKLKACKVIGKTMLKGNKLQLNFLNGGNALSDLKANIEDSVIIEMSNGKIVKHLPMKEGAKALILGGKHMGQRGTVDKIEDKEAVMKIGKESFNIKLRNVYVTA